MPLIQVRDVPEHLYRKLVERAERERRSVAQQVVAVLALGLDVEIDAKSRRRALLDKALSLQTNEVHKLTDPATSVRQDRLR